MKKKLRQFIGTLILLLAMCNYGYGQCAMCKIVAKSNLESGRNNVGIGINKGVLYMLAFPYALAGIGIFIWYRNRKKEKPGSAVS